MGVHNMAWVYQGESTYTINYTTESTDHEKKFISLNSLYNKLQKMLHMKFIQDNIDDIKFKKKYQKVVSNIFVYYYIQNIQDKDKQNY